MKIKLLCWYWCQLMTQNLLFTKDDYNNFCQVVEIYSLDSSTLFLSSCICLSIVSSHLMHGPYFAPRCTRSSWNIKMSFDDAINTHRHSLFSIRKGLNYLCMHCRINVLPADGVLIWTQGEPFFPNFELQIYGKGNVWRSWWILRKIWRGKSTREKKRDYPNTRILSEVEDP